MAIALSALPPVGPCGTVADFTFTVTRTSGAAVVGQQVLVSLPLGCRWPDGAPGSKTLATDGSGRITVSGVKASVIGTFVVWGRISPDGAMATTTLNVAAAVAGTYAPDGTTRTLPGIDLNTTAIGGNLFLTALQQLYWYDGGATPPQYRLIDSGVTSASGQHYAGPSATGSAIEVDMVSYVANGVATTWQSGSGGAPAVSRTLASVPSGATAVGWNTWLDSTGNLYHGNAIMAVGVTSAMTQHAVDANGTAQDWITYADAFRGYATTALNGSPVTPRYFLFPSGGSVKRRVVGWGTFLAENGELHIFSEAGALTTIAGVADASALHVSTPGGLDRALVSYVTTDGTAVWSETGGTSRSQFIGAGARAAGGTAFLGTDAKLWLGSTLFSTAAIIATDVQSANGYHQADGGAAGQNWVGWTQRLPSQCL
jgi:hypothetical protein